ncbi:MAG: hypothetical protein H7X92_03845 [Chitinophagales bacterium]|nr:hypothetical protein [Hyphomicrobiales bacterium]
MPSPTRTLLPLPFQHLEPKRFEDLIRQLIYDFRPWQSLEATGRLGSDDGYDARGWEIVPAGDALAVSDDDEDSDVEASQLRKWMVQCKRESTITPKKLGAYLDNVRPEEMASLHGLIFAACCEFSKKSRDLFRERCRSAGVAECFMWGRAEVEDMLLQPKNDALLFAYFGISLQVRKRSVKTQLRGRLTTKRKAYKVLDYIGKPVLLRDAENTDYPYMNKDWNKKSPPWLVREFYKHTANGVFIIINSYLAYLAEDDEHWDVANALNNSAFHYQDYWKSEEETQIYHEKRANIFQFRSDSEHIANFGTLEVKLIIPYEDIIAIDELGDDKFDGPQLYLQFPLDKLRCTASLIVPSQHSDAESRYVETKAARRLYYPEPDKRISVFPHNFRKPLLSS